MKKQVKALVLLSGGLDSILAVKLLLEQGIIVEAVNFRTNFCGPSKARLAAKMLGVNLREVNIRKDFLPILKHPRHGYGTGLNPCIDCHALMLKKAGEIMRAEGFDFIATGEVLGERPMSQHKKALDIVAKDADIVGYLLRPLSAKLLEPTIAENEGVVDRERLLNISGRSRKIQMALAEQYGIKEYPTPAGGCALTQKGFADRLRELMANKSDFNSDDVDLVAIGRHFWVAVSCHPGLDPGSSISNEDMDSRFPSFACGFGRARRGNDRRESGVQIILGRNQEENNILENIAGQGDILVAPDNFVGPLALVRGATFCHPELGSGSQDKGSRNEFGMTEKDIIDKAKELILQFSPKAKDLGKEDLRFKIKLI
ncbi:MAG: tRNA 4-thiouridine(8) synthase ThiI [Candidatus Portnoybacteria bacterium]|nr:tRNA 4-thiouridine(8) synthase ThiI [Candidatus Portnoybacteria bacterium]MDD4982668.1 tRNA 4-thiouridine(8) synthase ThiI [Candidatus Portnoybacteria bacterium]